MSGEKYLATFTIAKEARELQEIEKAKLLSRLENLRVTTKKFMTSSPFGIAYTNLLLAISIISCFQFIYQTYLNDPTPSISQQRTLVYFRYIEEVFATIFMFDWILSFFMADHKLKHILRFVEYLVARGSVQSFQLRFIFFQLRRKCFLPFCS